jgi:hypothetical protein
VTRDRGGRGFPAGLTGQGIIFLARFRWLDKVTFVVPPIGCSSPGGNDRLQVPNRVEP